MLYLIVILALTPVCPLNQKAQLIKYFRNLLLALIVKLNIFQKNSNFSDSNPDISACLVLVVRAP